MNMNKIVFKFVSISFSILVMLIVVIGLFQVGSYCYDFGYRVFTEEPVDKEPGRDVVVQITDDMSEREIGKMLEEKGLVEDGKLFFAQLKLSAYSGDLIPGVYTLNTSMTAKEMMVVMATAEEEETENSEAGASEEDTQTGTTETEETGAGE